MSNTNIKVNDDGTISPIDPNKPISYSANPQANTLDELKMNLWSVADTAEVEELVAKCEGKHIQQVVYSTYHKGMTQICFGCMAVNTSIPITQLKENK